MSECVCKPSEVAYVEHVYCGEVLALAKGDLPPVLYDPFTVIVAAIERFGVAPRPKCAACGLRRGGACGEGAA